MLLISICPWDRCHWLWPRPLAKRCPRSTPTRPVSPADLHPDAPQALPGTCSSSAGTHRVDLPACQPRPWTQAPGCARPADPHPGHTTPAAAPPRTDTSPFVALAADSIDTRYTDNRIPHRSAGRRVGILVLFGCRSRSCLLSRGRLHHVQQRFPLHLLRNRNAHRLQHRRQQHPPVRRARQLALPQTLLPAA